MERHSLALAVRGNNNRIYWREYNSSTWSDWSRLPGATLNAPVIAVLDNDLHIVVIGTLRARLIWRRMISADGRRLAEPYPAHQYSSNYPNHTLFFTTQICARVKMYLRVFGFVNLFRKSREHVIA